MTLRVCTIDGCTRTHFAGGFCNAHYLRHRDGRDMNAPIRSRDGRIRPCSIDGCDRQAMANGMCGMHYQRKRSGLDMHAPVGARRVKRPHDKAPSRRAPVRCLDPLFEKVLRMPRVSP